ncbi:MAG: hypothetical protein WAN87_01355 [Thermoplasmata archaeon]
MAGTTHGLERGHRVYGTSRVRLSLVIRAPSRYVYEWCTDYRASDASRFSKGRPPPPYRVIRVSPRHVLRVRVYPGLGVDGGRDPEIAVDLVRLNPPHSWHLEQIAETDSSAMDYRVTAMGRARTRLHLLATERWLTPDHPTKEERRAAVAAGWARYGAACEIDYRAGQPAKGP